ncbi:IS701 family transposase [Amycolatopsis nigrescens]|uniref:IS701 family transposase n=1 Tax=Amycolatopsis nigrescens TaxID=381445 RepID=UPI0003A833DC|nr:transposase [Amycolatopsis nigrescens]
MDRIRPMAGVPGRTDDLSRYCQEIFYSLRRADQRRWAEVYLRGLLFLPGRKSIRRISDEVVGRRAEQSLQQFVNQSPWRWEPVRRELALRADAVLRPRAWVAEEVVFPKYGNNSVGVANQRSWSLRRTLNCQLGLVLFLRNDEFACAADWRLMLPKSWEHDTARRARAGVPEHEPHRPRWRHLLGVIDELTGYWGLTPAPVLLDARGERWLDPLLHGFEDRKISYAVRVSERGPGGWRPVPPGPSTGTPFTLSGVLAGTSAGAPARRFLRPRRLLAEWSPDRRRVVAAWLTNFGPARLPELIGLVKLKPTGEQLTELHDEFGLRHFEGRSFAGWHHHVTLVAAAHTYRTLRRAEAHRAETTLLRRNA